MGFGQATAAGFNNYFDFRGRASRPEYWYFMLFLLVMGFVTAFLDIILFAAQNIGPLNILFSLATVIPSLSLSVRRLHDIGRSGWWLLLALIPVIGWIIMIYWACQPTMPQQNQYGPPPTPMPA